MDSLLEALPEFDPLRQGILMVLSLAQLSVNWIAGDKNDFAWIFGLAWFAPWVGYILYFNEFGLAFFVVGAQIVYVRNLVKNYRKRRAALPSPGAAPRSRPA